MSKFFMLIGLPGSGKSKTASSISLSENAIVISSDAIRKEWYGDAAIQDNPNKVFEEMQRRTLKSLKDGVNVVYDATNISRKKRRHLVKNITFECEKIACVVWAKYETCILRDSIRTRSVGEPVIKRMISSFQPPYYDEGWDKIKFILNDIPYSEADYEAWLNCNHDNSQHNNSVKQHIVQVLNEVNKLGCVDTNNEQFLSILLAASLRDIGKQFTKSFKNCKGETTTIAHFYNHQFVGSYLAIGYEKTLLFPDHMRALIYWLINVHMDPFLKTKYYFSLPADKLLLLNALHQCDIAGA